MTSDIHLHKLIFSRTPAALHPYIKLARLDRPTGVWLLLLPGWWAIVLSKNGAVNLDGRGLVLMILFAAGAVLMRAAGCIINDLWDRELDARVARTQNRPLAARDLSPRQAGIFLAGLLTLSFFILLLMPPLAIGLGVLSLLPVALYPWMKRITWWPQAFLGLTFNWGALLGWAAATGHLAAPAVFLYIAGIFWTLGYDTIYAHQDKRDDAALNLRSTALLLGERSRFCISVFYALGLLFLILAKYTSAPNILTPLLLAFVILHGISQLRSWEMNDPESCRKVFNSNRNLGLLVLLMLAV